MEITVQVADKIFELISGARILDRLEATKYLFFVLCLKSFYELLVYNTNTLLYEVPPVSNPDDMAFDFDEYYYLRILSTTAKKLFSQSILCGILQRK